LLFVEKLELEGEFCRRDRKRRRPPADLIRVDVLMVWVVSKCAKLRERTPMRGYTSVKKAPVAGRRSAIEWVIIS
jgi:hypothetical protein